MEMPQYEQTPKTGEQLPSSFEVPSVRVEEHRLAEQAVARAFSFNSGGLESASGANEETLQDHLEAIEMLGRALEAYRADKAKAA